MRALEGGGRPRRANERVAEFQSRVLIAALWGDGDKASADMMSLDASSRHLWNARVDPRRRTYAAGLYTHVRDRWGIVYDQPIVLNERQAGVAIEGIEAAQQRGGSHRISLLAVDTHGYTNPAMAVASCWASTCVHGCGSGRESSTCREVSSFRRDSRLSPSGGSLAAIERGWDELLRLAKSIRSGRRYPATLALPAIFGSAARGSTAPGCGTSGPTAANRVLGDYIAIDDFRREIHTC